MGRAHWTLVILPILSANLAAQIVGPAVPILPEVDSTGVVVNETAIGVSRANPNVLLASTIRRLALPRQYVIYSISTNGGLSWSGPQPFLPPQPCFDADGSADPSVASNTAGDLFLCATAYNGSPAPGGVQGMYVGRKPFLQPTITDITNATPCVGSGGAEDGDRSRIVFGPGPAQSAEYGFIGYYRPIARPPIYDLYGYGVRTSAADSLALSWSAPRRISLDGNDQLTRGVHPAIVLRGPVAGRIVVVLDHPVALGSPPIAEFSDDRGDSWQRGVVGAAGAGGELTTLNTYRSGKNDLPIVDSHAVARAQGVWGADLAADPAHDNTVYAVRAGAAKSDPANMDMFLFRSTDGGASFPFADRLRLTDALISDTDIADQFMPGLYVDQFGGINLLYYQSSVPDNNPVGRIDAYYARITGYNAQDPAAMHIFRYRLTPITFTIPSAGAPHSYGFVGDYQFIDGAGCYVYMLYMSTHQGYYQIYCNRIYLPECAAGAATADFNRDSSVNASDLAGFVVAFASGRADADVDRNDVLGIVDFLAYAAAYDREASSEVPRPR